MSPIEVTTITTSKEMGNYVVEYPGATLVYNESAQTKMDVFAQFTGKKENIGHILLSIFGKM